MNNTENRFYWSGFLFKIALNNICTNDINRSGLKPALSFELAKALAETPIISFG
ncbi:hypothetical protein [Chryseobacterium sp.]|uniref:hypothetical protein n=1 Tax=Chryseobacterium sp. TaxID=1871047 RepID=UPI0025C1DBD9|nr:hypothetical protein [Chryseobacterium sp.]